MAVWEDMSLGWSDDLENTIQYNGVQHDNPPKRIQNSAVSLRAAQRRVCPLCGLYNRRKGKQARDGSSFRAIAKVLTQRRVTYNAGKIATAAEKDGETLSFALDGKQHRHGQRGAKPLRRNRAAMPPVQKGRDAPCSGALFAGSVRTDRCEARIRIYRPAVLYDRAALINSDA